MATIRDKVGHLEIDLLYAHLDASLVANYLETMNGGPNFSSANRAPQKSGLSDLRGIAGKRTLASCHLSL